MDYKWFLFQFEGLINRAKYWLAALIILCWMIFVLMLLTAFGKLLGIADRGYAFDAFGVAASLQLPDHDPASKTTLFPQVIIIPMTVVFACAYAATSIKRLHDHNRSGWWIVPFVVAPVSLAGLTIGSAIRARQPSSGLPCSFFMSGALSRWPS